MMKRKSGLDERQREKRNAIGYQSFLLLMYLLLIDGGLFGFGVRWIEYPANIILIITMVAGVHVIRLVKNQAYVGPRPEVSHPVLRILLMVAVAMMVAVMITGILVFGGLVPMVAVRNLVAPLLFITAISALIVAGLTGLIIKWQNKEDERREFR